MDKNILINGYSKYKCCQNIGLVLIESYGDNWSVGRGFLTYIHITFCDFKI